MSPEEKQVIEDLRDYFTKQIDGVRELIGERDRLYTDRFNAQEKAVLAALASAKEATMKEEASSDAKFKSVNELRALANDILNKAMTRLEAESRFAALAEKMEAAAKSNQEKIESAISVWDKRHNEVVDRQSATDKTLVAMSSEKAGAKTQAVETKDNTARIMSIVVGVIVIAQFFWNLLSPVITKVLLSK